MDMQTGSVDSIGLPQQNFASGGFAAQDLRPQQYRLPFYQ